MFRGGRVDSRGTGIASGLSYAKGGQVPRTNYSVGGIGRQMANVVRTLDDARGGSGIVDEFGQKLTYKPTQVVEETVQSTTPPVKPQMSRPSMIDYQSVGQPKVAEEFIEAIRNPNTGGIDYKMAEMKIGTKLKGDESIEELVSMYLYSVRKDKAGIAALATGYGGLGAGAMMNEGQNYMANGGRVGLGNGGSYADALAEAEFNANRGNRLTFQSIIERMNDYYNKLYTGGVNEFDLDMGLQLAPPMSTEDIAQSNLYRDNQPEFQKEFLKGTFDGVDYNKKLAADAKQFAKFHPDEKNPYLNPDAPAVEQVLPLDAGEGGDGGGTTDPKADIEKNKELFAELLGGKKARGEDISNMLMSFAGKALKEGATTKSAFGEFFEEESKRPSSKSKIDQSAAALAINDYIAGKRSKEQTEALLAKLELSSGSLTAKYNDARKAGASKEKAIATAIYDKFSVIPKKVTSIPETLEEINELGLSNGDIIIAPNEINGNKVTSVLKIVIDSTGNISTSRVFPDL